jgi:hypothetical protein
MLQSEDVQGVASTVVGPQEWWPLVLDEEQQQSEGHRDQAQGHTGQDSANTETQCLPLLVGPCAGYRHPPRVPWSVGLKRRIRATPRSAAARLA